MQTDESFEDMRPTPSRGAWFWNLLTFLLLMGSAILVVLFILIYTNPYISLNPFPPPSSGVSSIATMAVTLSTSTETPTVTITNTIFPPTWTPTWTLSPTYTPSVPVESQTSTQIPVEIETNTATLEFTLTPTDRPDMAFAILGTPSAVSSTFTRPGSDCKWMGVGGQVLDMQDAAIVGTTIELGGTLNSSKVDLLSLTGTALQYGTAGYEFTLGDAPTASSQTLWVQLLDQAGLPLSDKVYFDTYSDCTKNLILITFKQVRQ